MLDVGMTGHLDEESIITIARILRALNEKDSDHIIKGLQELGIVVKETDKRQLRHDLTELIEMYADRPFKTISLNRMNQQLLEIMARHNMALPSNLVMMLRAMSIAESIGKQLEPEFDMFAIVEPFVKRIFLKLYSPKSFRKRSMNVMDESIELIEHFPQNISDLLRKLKEGQFEIKLEHQNLENLQDEMKSSSNRISASLIIAALIVGSSLILQQRIGPLISDISILGVIGYLLAGIMGLGLLLTIFKTRRKK
jgi:ubiquinone biosynthesis protein